MRDRCNHQRLPDLCKATHSHFPRHHSGRLPSPFAYPPNCGMCNRVLHNDANQSDMIYERHSASIEQHSHIRQPTSISVNVVYCATVGISTLDDLRCVDHFRNLEMRNAVNLARFPIDHLCSTHI